MLTDNDPFLMYRGGESMVFIGLLSWNATALQYLKGKNASFHLQVDTSLQSNGQIAGTNVGTGIYFNILFMMVDVKDHKRKFLFGKFVCLILPY